MIKIDLARLLVIEAGLIGVVVGIGIDQAIAWWVFRKERP